MNNVPFDERQPASGFVEGRPHPSSQGEQILFWLQQKLGYLYDFEFNVPIGCDRGYDEMSGRELGIAWITPDLSHREASFAVEIDGIQHGLPSILNDDIERDGLLAQEGWTVLRIPNYEVCNMKNLAGVMYRIEYGVMFSLLGKDINAGVPLHLRRHYPIGVGCTRCGSNRPGHKVGDGELCIDCLAGLSDGPYRSPLFECFACGREMGSPNDLETWERYDGPPASFECHSHLNDYWEE